MAVCIAARAVCASCHREIRSRADLRSPFGPAVGPDGGLLCASCNAAVARAYREYVEEKRAQRLEIAEREADSLTPVELLLLHARRV